MEVEKIDYLKQNWIKSLILKSLGFIGRPGSVWDLGLGRPEIIRAGFSLLLRIYRSGRPIAKLAGECPLRL